MGKRILIVANDDLGLYNFRKELLQYYIGQGVETHISVPDGPRVKAMTDMGCIYHETPIDRRGTSPIHDLGLITHYIRLFKSVHPDCIISYTIKPNMYGGMAARLLKIPFYPYVAGLGTPFQHDNILSRILITGHRIAFKKSKTVFFENVDSMAFYKEHRIVRGECVKIPGAGVNLDEYAYKEMPSPNHTEFVFVGRVMKEKGIDELFEASKRVKEKYPDTVINIVGPCEEDYTQQMEELQSQGIIKYWGFQMDVKPIVYQSHCLVLPSYHEGMANVLLEAAAMGRILITSDIHGCKEAVNHRNGILIKPKDTESLLTAMMDVCSYGQQAKQNAGLESRKHMEKIFDRYNVVRTVAESVDL